MTKKKLIIIILFFTGICSTNAQTVNELKKRKNEIEKEITQINNLISKTEKETKTSLSNIRLAKRKIELKKQLIKELETEESELQGKVVLRNKNIDSLKNLTDKLRLEYTKIIIYQSKVFEKNKLLMLLLSSNDFNQAYKRIKFYNQLLDYKQLQVNRFKITMEDLKREREKLNDNIFELTEKQKERNSEIKGLKNEQIVNERRIQNLEKRKKDLIADLENQKRISEKLSNEIKRLIAEEARKAAKEKNNVKRNNNIALSSNFKENIGKFSLPVDKGIITGTYGESFHPILKDIKIKNNGIDITVSSKNDVYTVFRGEVRKVFKIPGSNLAVIIRHGNYLTVYSNLTSVSVNVGQEVKANEKIGEISIPKNEERNILHFELWNESKTEDPLKWIKKN